MLKMISRIAKVSTIISLFIGISLIPLIGGINQYSQTSDSLDQQQARSVTAYFLAWPNKLAQSFKPESNHLTRIHLSVSKVQTPSNLSISIRKELDGNDLTSITIQSKYLFTYPKRALFDCDIPDITVIPEQTYYIIFQYESEPSEDDMLNWWYDPNSTYMRGTAWQWTVENGSQWNALNYDFCFKIFSVSTQNNTANNSTDDIPDDSNKTPGFELVVFVSAIALFVLFKRKKKM